MMLKLQKIVVNWIDFAPNWTVIERGGKMLLQRNRVFWLVLLIVPLLSACGSSKLPPVERLVTQTEVVETVPNPGNLPDQVTANESIADFEIITQSNVYDIIAEVEKGEREPLNHVMIQYNLWLAFAEYMARLEKYVTQADPKLRRWQRLYQESLEKGAPPPNE